MSDNEITVEFCDRCLADLAEALKAEKDFKLRRRLVKEVDSWLDQRLLAATKEVEVASVS